MPLLDAEHCQSRVVQSLEHLRAAQAGREHKHTRAGLFRLPPQRAIGDPEKGERRGRGVASRVGARHGAEDGAQVELGACAARRLGEIRKDHDTLA